MADKWDMKYVTGQSLGRPLVFIPGWRGPERGDKKEKHIPGWTPYHPGMF